MIAKPLQGHAVEFFLFVMLSVLAFESVPEKLFFGMDGLGLLTSIELLSQSTDYSLGLPSNPYQGLGAIYGLNINLIPAFFAYKHIGASGPYVLAAIELYIATYLLGAALSFAPTARRIGGYVVAIFSLPYFDQWQIYPVFNLAPNIAEVLAAAIFAGACVGFTFHSSLGRCLAGYAGGMIAVTWILASQPTYLVLFVPLLGMLAVSFWLNSKSKKHASITACIWAALISGFTLTVGGDYVLGIFLFTASHFFTAELNGELRPTLYSVSIAFQSAAHGNAGAFLTSLAALAAFRFMLFRPACTPHWSVALTLLPFAVYGAAFMTSDSGWPYPLPIYFEFSLWPIYALFAGSFLSIFLERLPDKQDLTLSRWRKHKAMGFVIRNFSAQTVASMIIFSVALLVIAIQTRIPTGDILGRPPQPTKITNMLAASIGISEPKEFAGYTANFSSYSNHDTGISWIDLVTGDLMVAGKTGNSHRMMGLWSFGIPTIEEYQPITNPYLYLLTSRVLSHPQDKQTRNIILLNRVVPNVLRMLGVRFVISNKTVSDANEVTSVDIPGAPKLRLFEFSRVNQGHYSPTSVIRVDSTSDALEALQQTDIDFTQVAITFEDLETPLVPATDAIFSVGVDGYNVKAKTTGESLLILPLQFSHCIVATGKESNSARLLRTNMLLTGLLFKGEINLDLKKRVGLFSNSDCRKKDYDQAKKLKLDSMPTKLN